MLRQLFSQKTWYPITNTYISSCLDTLLHEIKALQQITYLKLARSFNNVNPTKNAFFLTLINVIFENMTLINVLVN